MSEFDNFQASWIGFLTCNPIKRLTVDTISGFFGCSFNCNEASHWGEELTNRSQVASNHIVDHRNHESLPSQYPFSIPSDPSILNLNTQLLIRVATHHMQRVLLWIFVADYDALPKVVNLPSDSFI